MTEEETREAERDLWLAHAAMEAFADALPGLDPATIEDLTSGGHAAVEAARAADPLWRLYLWFTEAWETVGDAAEDVAAAPPEVVEAARALARVARNGTAAVATSPTPPTVARRRDVYVRLRHFTTVGETRDLGDGVHVDLGDDGEVLGVEVLDAIDLQVNGATLPGVNPLQAQLEASERLRAGLRTRLAEAQQRVVVKHDRALALSGLLRGMARRASANRRATVTLARDHAAMDQAALGTFRELRDGLEGLRQGLLAALNARESAFDSLTLLRNLVGQRDALRQERDAVNDALREAGFEHPLGSRGVRDALALQTQRWEAANEQLGDALARLEEATLRLATEEQEGSDAVLRADALAHDLVQARLERDAALTQRDNLDADRRTLWEKCERLQATNDELAPLAIDQRELAGRLEIVVSERDAHARTLDHALVQLHEALGWRPEDASLATLPDALEQVGHLMRRSRQDALDDLASRRILETRLDDVTRELIELRGQLHARATMEDTVRTVVKRALGREASDLPTVNLARELEEILGNVKRASHRMRAELADARQVALAALGLDGKATAEVPLADLVGELEVKLREAREADTRDAQRVEAQTDEVIAEIRAELTGLREQRDALLEDNRRLTHQAVENARRAAEDGDQLSSLSETCKDLEAERDRHVDTVRRQAAILEQVRERLERHGLGNLPAGSLAHRVGAALDLLASQRDEAVQRRAGTWRRGDPDDAACTCSRFRDTGGVRIADLACPEHGVDAGGPHDGPWENDEFARAQRLARAERHVAALAEQGDRDANTLVSQHVELTELRARIAELEAAASGCAECGYRNGRHHYWCRAGGGVPGVTAAPRSTWTREGGA